MSQRLQQRLDDLESKQARDKKRRTQSPSSSESLSSSEESSRGSSRYPSPRSHVHVRMITQGPSGGPGISAQTGALMCLGARDVALRPGDELVPVEPEDDVVGPLQAISTPGSLGAGQPTSYGEWLRRTRMELSDMPRNSQLVQIQQVFVG